MRSIRKLKPSIKLIIAWTLLSPFVLIFVPVIIVGFGASIVVQAYCWAFEEIRHRSFAGRE